MLLFALLLESAIRELFLEKYTPLSFSLSMPSTIPTTSPTITSTPEDLYQPVDLDRYCKENYSVQAFAIQTGDHAYDWKCLLDANDFPISMDAICRQQWVKSYSTVLLGGSANDWACVDWTNFRNKVVPVVVIPVDLFFDTNHIAAAVKASVAAMDRARTWYAKAMDSGRTFEIMRPIVHFSMEFSSTEWNELSCLAISPPRPRECIDQDSPIDRYGYIYKTVEEALKTSLPPWSSETIVPVFVYTGRESHAFWFGGASWGPYSSMPPNVAACDIDSNDDCGLDVVVHEIGHNFGLGHSCDIEPQPINCSQSIMQAPADLTIAILLEQEQSELDASAFFGGAPVGEERSSKVNFKGPE